MIEETENKDAVISALRDDFDRLENDGLSADTLIHHICGRLGCSPTMNDADAALDRLLIGGAATEAIKFAAELGDLDASDFLRSWLDGDFSALDMEYPEWRDYQARDAV